jgi:hypothetical protein
MIVLAKVPLNLHWPTLDPFLFCAHHRDDFPPGNDDQGVEAHMLTGRRVGSDFELRDGWRMYHGRSIPGFPRHPHRGFETITIAEQGFIDHADSLGAQSRFGQGDVQWMTAGRGVVHSEMFPLVRSDARNPTELFQIWLNLPSTHKLVDPTFKMIWREQLPRWTAPDGDVTVTVIAGQLGDAIARAAPVNSWAADPSNGINIWTIEMEPNARWVLPESDAGGSRVLSLYDTGGSDVAGERISDPCGLQLKADAAIPIQNKERTTRALLLEGRPLNEPVAQHGPFVMNRRDELEQAFRDYNETGFGGWPWPVDGPVLPSSEGRFARYEDGREEFPDGES